MANIFDTNKDGTYLFGEGAIRGWAFDSTLPNSQKERSIRNAMLAVLRHQADGDHKTARKILNLQVNGKTVAGVICEGIMRYSLASDAAQEATKASSEVAAEAVRTMGSAKQEAAERPPVQPAGQPTIINRDQADKWAKNLCEKHKLRPKLVEHHQNGNKAKVFIWTDQQTHRVLDFIAYEVLDDNRRLVLDRMPVWAARGNGASYIEHQAYVSEDDDGKRYAQVKRSEAAKKMFEQCVDHAQTVPEMLDKDLSALEAKSDKMGPNLPDGRNPWRCGIAGDQWFEKTKTGPI